MPQIPSDAEPTRRLYFALWPDGTMQAELAVATRAVVRGSGGRAIPRQNLHITLAFLGSVPERRLPELADVAQRTAAARSATVSTIEMTLDRVEHWLKPRILCATPTDSPRIARDFADALKQALVSASFAPDLKPFHPHVTLARKVSRPSHELSMQSVVWKFDVFSLVESRTEPAGAIYSIVDFWRLDAGKKPLKK